MQTTMCTDEFIWNDVVLELHAITLVGWHPQSELEQEFLIHVDMTLTLFGALAVCEGVYNHISLFCMIGTKNVSVKIVYVHMMTVPFSGFDLSK